MHVLLIVLKSLLPRQAGGLRAPQTIIRRPLPSPDRHNNSVCTGCSWGSLLYPSGEHFSSDRLHICKFPSGSLACIVDNAFIIFSHRFLMMFRFFFVLWNYFFTISFLVLPCWSNDLGSFVENLLHLAIDPQPVCPNRAPAWTLISEMVHLGQNPWR